MQTLSQETQELLARYTTNRSTILRVLKSENFLEEILKRLFTTTSKGLEIPKASVLRSGSSSKNKEALAHQLVDFVYKEIQSKDHFQESYLKAFLEGMKASQNGKQLSQFSGNEKEFVMEMYQTEQNLKRSKNLKKSDAYFSGLDSRQELISLIPKKIYYKVLRKGIGPSLSSKTQNVSFHYTYRI